MVAATAIVDATAQIGPHVVIDAGAEIGPRCSIGPGVAIGAGDTDCASLQTRMTTRVSFMLVFASRRHASTVAFSPLSSNACAAFSMRSLISGLT